MGEVLLTTNLGIGDIFDDILGITDRCTLSVIFPCVNIQTLAAVFCTPMLDADLTGGTQGACEARRFLTCRA